MNLLLYLPTEAGPGGRLQQVLEETAAVRSLETFHTMEALSARLRQPHYDCHLAILLAATPRDLIELSSVRHLFQDLRVVLVLPDRSEESTTLAHTLCPRVLCYIDSDFTEISAVLERVSHGLEHMEKREPVAATPN